MKKILLLFILTFTTNIFGQTYTFNLKTGVLCNTCWDPDGPPGPTYDTFTASSFSWNVKNNGTTVASHSQSGYVPNGTSYMPYSNVTASLNSTFSISILSTGKVHYEGSSGSCNTNTSASKSLENLIIDGSMGFSDSQCGINALITSFKPDATITNRSKTSTICSGQQLELEGTPGYPNVVYHWQYSKDNKTTWIDVPLKIGVTNTNNIPQTAFSINDLLGISSEQFHNKKFHFRLGYGQNRPFSNEIEIIFSPCAPVMTDVNYFTPVCNDDIRKVEVTFNEALKNDEILDRITMIDVSSGLERNQRINVTYDVNTKIYSFINFDPLENGHTYKISYQLKKGNALLGFLDSPKNFTYKEINPITFQTTPTNILCYGESSGIITVINPLGGNGGYTYSKDGTIFQNNPTFIGLSAGTYTITVKDNKECIATLLVTLTAPLKPISIKGEIFPSSGPDIADGSILLNNISGGKPTYKVFMGSIEDPDLSKLIAGSYPIKIVDSNNCSKDTILVVKQKITCIETRTNVKCYNTNDGSITLDIKGGSRNYNVVWNDNNNNINRSGLAADTYFYTITDDTNDPLLTFVSSPITITAPSSKFSIENPSIIQPSPTIDNGKIRIDVIGGYGNYTYSWTKNANPFPTPFPQSPDNITGLGDGEYYVSVTDKNTANTTRSGCSITQGPFVLKSLRGTINNTNEIKCIGATGTLEAMPEGGTGSYSYEWFNLNSPTTSIGSTKILTGAQVIPGQYKIEVTDGDYTVSSTYNLLGSPNPAIMITPTKNSPVKCNAGSDGSIEIAISGGTGIYTYAWSNLDENKNISGLKAGFYSITVSDDNKCTATFSNIEITQPTSPITFPTETITPVVINGESTGAINFALDPTGGTGGYTYAWTSSTDATFTSKTTKDILGLKAGLYTLTIEDENKCSVSKTFEVTQSLILKVNITTSIPIKCNGEFNGELTANVTGGIEPYKYNWSKNGQVIIGENKSILPNMGIGDYSVSVTDTANPEPTGPFANAKQLNYKVTQPDILTVSLSSQINVLCRDAQTGAINITINGGTAPYTQQWQKQGVNYAITEDLTQLPAGTYQVLVKDNHGCTISLQDPVIITQPNAPLVITDVEVKNLSGFQTKNGSIAVEISGGTAPYKYSFGTQTNVAMVESTLVLDKLAKGSYTLTIIDANGCITSKNHNLTEPEKLIITSITQSPTSTIKCFGDKTAILEATITGGVLPYTYNWHNVLTPNTTASTTNPSETVVAGTYELTVTDANDNIFTLQSNPVIEPALLKIDYTQTNVSCKNEKNGSISISVSGGTGSHNISWSTGANSTTISNLSAATYSVTVTDANLCQTTETITITEPDLLYVSKITKNPPSALGLQDGSIEIQVTGGTPNYNYLWYNGTKDLIHTDLNQPSKTSINNIYAGQYFVTVTDKNGCGIIEKDLDKIDPLVLSVNQINIVKCNEDATASIKAAASGGTPIYYYKWYKTTDPVNPIGQEETLTNISAGTYYVVLSDSFGLSQQSENSIITQPNPLNNTLTSQYTRCGDANDWTITTSPTGGTAPYSYLWNTDARNANLVDVIPGNYSVLVTDNNGCSVTKDITITAPTHLNTAEIIKKPTCFEGSDATIVLTSSGGQGPYTYLWNTGETSNILNNASAKVYTVAVTDAKGCVINKTYTIENPPKNIINLGEDVTLCFDQSLTINATIADDKAKYSWTSTKGFTSNKPIITISESADYTLVVTNNLGCNATDTIKISSQSTAISSEFAVSSQVFMNEKFIIVDISNPIADNIEWILPAEATVISKNSDYAELSFSKVGEYELTLNTTKGNCTATKTKSIVVIEGEYVDPDSTDLKKNFDLKIYPNPSNGVFSVDVTLDKVMPAHIKVYNLTNNMIIDSKYEEGKDKYTFNFSLNGIPAGVYFVLVESQQGNQLRKIIIN